MNPIVVAKSRNLSDLFSDSLQFFFKNFSTLAPPVLIIVGPVLLISGIASGLWFADYFSAVGEIRQSPPGDMESLMSFYATLFSPTFFIMMITSWLGAALQIAVVNQYMILYDEKGNIAPSVDEILPFVFKDFVSNLGITFVGFTLYLIGSLFCILPGIYLGVILVLMCIIVKIEGVGVFRSIGRCFTLMKDHWWESFGLYLIIYVIILFASSIVQAPIMLSGINSVNDPTADPSIFNSDIFNSATGIMSSLLTGLLYSIFIIGTVLQYFNLSGEKGNSALDSRIDEIGRDT